MIRIIFSICLLAAFSNVAAQQDRDNWQKVPEIFEAMGVEEGSHVADIGAGWGYFTTRFGKAVGPQGRVLAVDIDEKILEDLRQAVKKEGLTNVEVIISKPDDPMLPDGSIDAALIINTYHEMTEYEAMLAHIFRALKPGGRLAIVDGIEDKRRGQSRAEQSEKHQLGIGFGIAELEQAGFIIVEVPARGRY